MDLLSRLAIVARPPVLRASEMPTPFHSTPTFSVLFSRTPLLSALLLSTLPSALSAPAPAGPFSVCTEASGCYSPDNPLVVSVMDWNVPNAGLAWAVSDDRRGLRPPGPYPPGSWMHASLGLSDDDIRRWFPELGWFYTSYVYSLRRDGSERVNAYRMAELPADEKARLQFWLDRGGEEGRRVFRRPGSRALSETRAYAELKMRGYDVPEVLPLEPVVIEVASPQEL